MITIKLILVDIKIDGKDLEIRKNSYWKIVTGNKQQQLKQKIKWKITNRQSKT